MIPVKRGRRIKWRSTRQEMTPDCSCTSLTLSLLTDELKFTNNHTNFFLLRLHQPSLLRSTTLSLLCEPGKLSQERRSQATYSDLWFPIQRHMLFIIKDKRINTSFRTSFQCSFVSPISRAFVSNKHFCNLTILIAAMSWFPIARQTLVSTETSSFHMICFVPSWGSCLFPSYRYQMDTPKTPPLTSSRTVNLKCGVDAEYPTLSVLFPENDPPLLRAYLSSVSHLLSPRRPRSGSNCSRECLRHNNCTRCIWRTPHQCRQQHKLRMVVLRRSNPTRPQLPRNSFLPHKRFRSLFPGVPPSYYCLHERHHLRYKFSCQCILCDCQWSRSEWYLGWRWMF